MARPRLTDMKLVTQAQKAVAQATDVKELRAAQSVLLPALLGATLTETAVLLGEFLQVHLICTVNCPIDRLDPAIIRPGRLLAYRKFKRLSGEKATRLAEVKGLKLLTGQNDYSIAEIYASKQWIDDDLSKRSIGFAT